MVNGLHIIKYPTGRYGFVGLVPSALAFNSQHGGDLATAAQCGPGIARRIAEREGRTFDRLTWSTEEDAREAAAAMGFKVST